MIRDLTNKKFGQLTIKYIAPTILTTSGKIPAWYCECSCSNVCIVTENDLITHEVTSCGCCDNDIKSKSSDIKIESFKKTRRHKSFNIEDLSGQYFGKLLVLPEYEIRLIGKNKIKMPYWLCRCECGNEKFISAHHLKSGNTLSCGCLRIKKLKESYISRAKSKLLNKYDLVSNPYGVGYCANDNSEFYFDLEDYDKIKNYTWSNFNGYIMTRVNNTNININSLIMPKHEGFISYVRGRHSAHDNRKSNLRLVDHAQKFWNSNIRSNNTSGITGVSYSSKNNIWIAHLCCRGERLQKTFTSKNDAIRQRKAWEEEYFGEYRHIDN